MKFFESVDGRKIQRVSGWITVRKNYRPNKRNSLWDYVWDCEGRHPYQDGFDKDCGLSLMYFRYYGRTYALDQFLRIPPIEFKEHGESHFISTVDIEGNIYRPLYAEWDACCERVRLYEVL